MTKDLMPLNEIEEVSYQIGYGEWPLDSKVQALIETARAAHELREENEALRNIRQQIVDLRDSHKRDTGECETNCDFVTAWNDVIGMFDTAMKRGGDDAGS